MIEEWYPQAVENGLTMEIYLPPTDWVADLSIEDKFETLAQKNIPIITPKAENADHAHSIIREYTRLYFGTKS